jgi:FixJ family two-component response regulator
MIDAPTGADTGTGAAAVILIDDDPAVLLSLSRLLRSAGHRTESFASAQEFIDRGMDGRTGCLVLDVHMPSVSGIELQHMLVARGSLLAVIFLTGHGDLHMGVQAMKAGAVDFLTKPVDADQLVAAVGLAVERSRVADNARSARQEVAQRLQTLTPREREVLALVVAGRLNKQAAAELGTVEKTIKVHRARVMTKMKARTLPELVRLAELGGVGVPVSVIRPGVDQGR